MSNPSRVIDAQQIETAIMMLKQYAPEDDIAPLIDVLESIAADPRNECCSFGCRTFLTVWASAGRRFDLCTLSLNRYVSRSVYRYRLNACYP